MSTLLQFNYMLFQAINAHAGEYSWLDALMIFCADSLIFCFPLLLIMLWGRPLSWRKQEALPQDEVALVQERRAVVLWVGIACLLAFGLNLAIEQFVFEPRPFASHPVHLLIGHSADASFPSDHAAWSFAVVGMLLLVLIPAFVVARHKRKEGSHGPSFTFLSLLTIVAFVIACSIGLARIYVGVHYPGDIIGGALDGLAASAVVTALRRWLRRPTRAVLKVAETLRVA